MVIEAAAQRGVP